ncbi:hypothetical protein [Chamaesiphon sp. OTE_20_metabat_361]|uniref:hypothetical protein n=1 Tax=Chamaesiphon sp. OTE_20_metabat_361 TaxID=2964689 RepID=UPI00286A903A|nr:hypothetical protein [Chamaesiphon sp. OTE_20_metabat_361]
MKRTDENCVETFYLGVLRTGHQKIYSVYDTNTDLDLMATTGKLELTIKISELPEVKTVENGLQHFELDDLKIAMIAVLTDYYCRSLQLIRIKNCDLAECPQSIDVNGVTTGG